VTPFIGERPSGGKSPIDAVAGGAIATGPVVRRVVTAGTIFVAYVAAAVVLTWPLAARLATHLPATGGTLHVDQYYAGWALAWQTHALVTAPTRIAEANIYWPTPHALFYGTPGFALLPVFAPLFAITGDVTTSLNATLLVCLALTASALHWVTVRFTGSSAAAVAAAATYLAASGAVTWFEVMPQYAAHAAMPLVAALVVGVPRTRRDTIVLAALLALQGLADVVYVALPFFAFTGVSAALALGRDHDGRAGMRRTGAALGLALVALAPVYAGYARVVWDNPDLRDQTVWGPPPLTYTYVGVLPDHGPLAFGLGICLAIGVGLWLHRRDATASRAERRAWIVAGTWLGVALALSWTIPSLVPGFHALLAAHVVRDPLRLGLTGLIGLCLLAGLAFAACVRAVVPYVAAPARRLVPATLLLAYVAWRVAVMTWPPGAHPLDPAPMPGAENAVLRAGSGPVVVLPLGTYYEQGTQAAAMYQTVGVWRPLLNGYSSYYPAGFRERMALAHRLPDGQALEQLRALGLATVVVRPGSLDQLVRQPWLRAIAEGRLGAVAVRLDQPGALVLDLVETPAPN
jgi:hypothetical protein